jgi:hypothetical protein
MSKHDSHAVRLWGPAYLDIPKSVFATIAWHLANEASGSADSPGAAVSRFLTELYTLGANDIISQEQVKASARALTKQRSK